MPKLPVNPSICEMVECKSGELGVGGGRVVEKRLGTWRTILLHGFARELSSAFILQPKLHQGPSFCFQYLFSAFIII